jgi:hypothetical protein
MSVGSLSSCLLGEDSQQFRLQLRQVETLLEGVLGQHHVVVNTGGVEHHAAEQLHTLHNLHNQITKENIPIFYSNLVLIYYCKRLHHYYWCIKQSENDMVFPINLYTVME